MKYYDVTLRVREDNLSTLISVVTGSADIMGLVPCAEVIPSKSTSRGPRFVGGLRNKGISGEDLVMQVLADGKIHPSTDFEKAFIAHNFAASSASSTLSKICKEAKVDRVGPFHYCKAGGLVGVPFTQKVV